MKLPAENAEVQEMLGAVLFQITIIMTPQNTYNLYICHNGSPVIAMKLENKLVLQVFN
jgi:hypothetical protein